MLTVSGMGGWQAVPALLGWSLVVLGVSKAVFRSFPAEELKAKLNHWFSARAADMRRLRWEIQHGKEYSRELAQGDQMAASRELSEAQVRVRMAKMSGFESRTRGLRVIMYLLQCVACQCFWSALALGVVTGVLSGGLVELVLTALMYSAAAPLLHGLTRGATVVGSPGKPQPGCPAGGCG